MIINNHLPGADPRAHLEVFSNASGKTFYTSAESPQHGIEEAVKLDTAIVTLKHEYTFRVRNSQPFLDFTFNNNDVEVFDDGGAHAGPATCPWLEPGDSSDIVDVECVPEMLVAVNRLHLDARKSGAPFGFYRNFGIASLTGVTGQFAFITGAPASGELFDQSDFQVITFGEDPSVAIHVLAVTPRHKKISIPLESLQIGDVFTVKLDLESYARNLVQGESFASAYFRDPANFDVAATIDFGGLEQIPLDDTPPPAPVPAACAVPDPTAGAIELTETHYSAPENEFGVDVRIRRTGGSHGDSVMLLETVDGTATSAGDYTAQHVFVHFADGDVVEQSINIPFTQDRTTEPVEAFTLRLTPFSGCAAPGAHATATVTILDDDRVVAPPVTFTVSGSISGLAGSGLVLQDQTRGVPLNASGNAFAFTNALSNGDAYHIVVQTQPSNPLQICTVTNGQGTIASANVTNVAISCTTPAAPGSLDASFGDHGRVATNVTFSSALFGGRVGIALQADGKILLVGGLKLLRLNPDGTLDGTFGTAGVAPVVFNGTTFDTAMDVAVQANGKIVVAGTASSGASNDDFALTRFNADGTLDTTFGAAGHVTTDFFGTSDQVRRMQLQADGRIVVIGRAAHPIMVTSGEFLFAIARYTVDGVLDTSFGSGGKSSDSPGGVNTDPLGLAIDGSGNFVLCGRNLDDGADDPDTGLLKFLGGSAPGVLDTSFGPQHTGRLTVALGLDDSCVDVTTGADDEIFGAINVSVSPGIGGLNYGFGLVNLSKTASPVPGAPQLIVNLTSGSDSPRAMLRQPDGKIVMVGESGVLSSNPNMAIVRFGADGLALDADFGTGGKIDLDFFGGTDEATAVAQQADGKIVVAGVARSGSTKFFAVTRVAQ
jgi:uncharacterized delta-60 repeat protein